MPFRFGRQQIHPANQRFGLAIAAPNPDRGELIPRAAGERIVAFGRPGKPPKSLFCGQQMAPPRHAKGRNSCDVATVSKALGVKGWAAGATEWP